MKARLENNVLVFYDTIPEQMTNGVLGTTIGGYDKLSDEIHKLDGFYDVVEPDFNKKLQELGEIYFDSDNEIYTYPVINKVITLKSEKNKKIKELKKKGQDKLSETDWYYLRFLRNGTPVPDDIQSDSDLTYFKLNKKESEINDLNDILDVLNYDTDL
jgi:hypothetical protein